MKVMKFGGTSVQNAESILLVKKIIQSESDKAVIVVSALSGITNMLEKIYNDLVNSNFKEAGMKSAEIKFIHLNFARELDVECSHVVENLYFSLLSIIESVKCLGETSLKVRDLVLSHGELLSSYIIFSFLKKEIASIELVDPREIIITDSEFNNAGIDDFATNIAVKSKLLPLFEKSKFVITGGFVGSDIHYRTTTLGRGGSDFTASIIGKFIHADSIEIWTDVDGIMTADPSIVDSAGIVGALKYTEALDIALSGGKVIHYKTIFPAMEKNIPIAIKNTFNTKSECTLISSDSQTDNAVKSIVSESGYVLIEVKVKRYYPTDFLQSMINSIILQSKIDARIIDLSNSEVKLLIRETDYLQYIQTELEQIGLLNVFQNQAIVSIIGSDILDNQNALVSVLTATHNYNFSIKRIIISCASIRVITNDIEIKELIKALHKHFFE